MSLIVYNIFGYFAIIGFASMYIPQISKTYRTKKASDLSWEMLFIQFMSTCFSVIYSVGVYEEGGIDVALPLFIGNPLVLTSVIVLMYLKYRYN
jgi:uncharacterized protein with PQ loop repeat